MSDWAIRLARPEDADAMGRVEEDADALFKEHVQTTGITLPTDQLPTDYRSIVARGRSLVAVRNEAVVGFAACLADGRDLHLKQMSVASAWQQEGMGSALLAAVIIDAANSGFRAITLDTFRRIAWNAPFYASRGFVEVEESKRSGLLMEALQNAEKNGFDPQDRCAMIRILD